MYARWKCQDCQFLKQSGLFSCKKKIYTDSARADVSSIAECYQYKEVKQKG